MPSSVRSNFAVVLWFRAFVFSGGCRVSVIPSMTLQDQAEDELKFRATSDSVSRSMRSGRSQGFGQGRFA